MAGLQYPSIVLVVWTIPMLYKTVSPHTTGNTIATQTATPPRANVSVVNVRARGVLLQWNAVGGAMGGAGDDATRTELLIRPLLSSKQQQHSAAQYHRLLLSTAPAPSQAHTVQVEDLLPDTEYVIEMFILPQNGAKIPLHKARFKTTAVADGSSASEVVLVAGAILLWVGAMCMFYRTYAKNCLNESREYRFEHEPKNIKCVQVIQESDTSVIQKKYNDEHMKTVEARRVHLERLNSMPNMKLMLPPQDTKLSPLAEHAEEPADNKKIRPTKLLKKVKSDTLIEMQEAKPSLRLNDGVTCSGEEAKSLL